VRHWRARHRARSVRRLPALGAATILLVGGGSGLLAVAFSNGPAAADSTLGGFTVSAVGEAVTAQYEQPNFPVPATPSLEFDEGYASTTDNFGPSGSATASSLYPGQVIANAGPQLGLLLPGVPLPPAPVWPVQATSEYPQAPNTGSTDAPGVNMDTSSTANGNTASATLGNGAPAAGASGVTPSQTAPSGSGNPFAGNAAFVGVGTLSATSSSQAPSSSANATASATVGGVSILGGLINIGSVTSTATATSDGTTGKVTGSTQVQNMSIAGEPVTVNANGISAAGQTTLFSTPIASINTLLNELGISMAVSNATDKVNGPSASRTLDGLRISIDIKTLDAAAGMFATLLPPSVTSQLPLALPNDQQLTLDLATVQVNSTASPAFVAGNSGAAPAPATTPAPSVAASPSFTGNSGSGTFPGTSGVGSTFTPTGTTGSGTPAATGSGSPAASTASAPTAALTGAAFKGVGAALVLLGLLAASALAYAYKRADDASELLGTSCAEGDPLMERFAATPDDLSEFGGLSR
jgi:hypothetical protein